MRLVATGKELRLGFTRLVWLGFRMREKEFLLVIMAQSGLRAELGRGWEGAG